MPIIKTYYKVHRVFPDPDYFYMENISGNDATFTVRLNGSAASTDLSYSLDKSTWTDIHNPQNSVYNITNVPDGGKVYFRSGTGLNLPNGNGFRFSAGNSRINIGGHIYTLVDYTATQWPALPDYCCSSLFEGASVVHANVDFTGITTVGEESLDRFLIQNPYLITPPDLSPVTTVGENGLNTAFYGCTSLQTPADLSNVTSVGPNGLRSMYEGCTLLNDAIAPNTSNWGFADKWLHNTAASGVVRKPAGLSIPTDSTSGVPTGWTTENY